ncbi:MAG TPA: fumarylacetoacetate hydrolase family protein [Candidatus Angelobacter sp.]|nr:fumarylacetoacetate hydrolase family protein [Candidatus Angelobacter sp.]
MKLIRYAHASGPRTALLHDGQVVDPLAIDEALGILDAEARRSLASIDMIIAAGSSALAQFERARVAAQGRSLALPRLADVTLLAPLVPPIILCAGSNYVDHNKEKAESPLKGKEPEFFLKSPTCVIGPGDPILWDRRVTKKLDYEVELAVVIGKPGRHVRVEDALDHVFGYTILNDVTARDRQVRVRDGVTWYELGSSKNFDSSAPLGPCLVTADEIPDPQALDLRTTVNGEVRQNNNTRSMKFGVTYLIHFFSTNMTLHPGMVISTGTPGGTGWASDPELGGVSYKRDDIVRPAGYLATGDVIACSIEGIGTLENRVRILE